MRAGPRTTIPHPGSLPAIDKRHELTRAPAHSHDTCHSRTLDPESVLQAEEKARDFMGHLSEVLGEHRGEDTTWIFGHKPTILDAHATALAARLMDAKRLDVLSEAVQIYTRRVLETEEWRAVTHGRPTLWDTSMGHVADLNPL